MTVSYSPISCSILQIFDLHIGTEQLISDIKKANKALRNNFRVEYDKEGGGYAYGIFSSICDDKNYKNLIASIKKNKLGPLTFSEPRKNLNTENIVQIAIWHFDWERIDKLSSSSSTG